MLSALTQHPYTLLQGRSYTNKNDFTAESARLLKEYESARTYRFFMFPFVYVSFHGSMKAPFILNGRRHYKKA